MPMPVMVSIERTRRGYKEPRLQAPSEKIPRAKRDQHMPTCQERVKGNELASGHTLGQAPQAPKYTGDQGRQTGVQWDPRGSRAALSLSAGRFAPDYPEGKGDMPDKSFFSETQHRNPFAQTPLCSLIERRQTRKSRKDKES